MATDFELFRDGLHRVAARLVGPRPRIDDQLWEEAGDFAVAASHMGCELAEPFMAGVLAQDADLARQAFYPHPQVLVDFEMETGVALRHEGEISVRSRDYEDPEDEFILGDSVNPREGYYHFKKRSALSKQAFNYTSTPEEPDYTMTLQVNFDAGFDEVLAELDQIRDVYIEHHGDDFRFQLGKHLGGAEGSVTFAAYGRWHYWLNPQIFDVWMFTDALRALHNLSMQHIGENYE